MNFKPARTEAQSDEDEILCDLDVITQKKLSFVLHGKTHVLLPVTVDAFLAFWEKCIEFKKIKLDTGELQNKAYFGTIKTLCDTITLKDVEQMTLLQKSVLIESLVGKIVGNKTIFEAAQKKNWAIPNHLESISALRS